MFLKHVQVVAAVVVLPLEMESQLRVVALRYRQERECRQTDRERPYGREEIRLDDLDSGDPPLPSIAPISAWIRPFAGKKGRQPVSGFQIDRPR